MAKGKRALSAQQVAALTDNGTHRVDNQLYLQIREQGTRSWVFRYSRNGKTHWVGLGAANDVPLSRAKELAVVERAKLINGGNPIAERRAVKESLRLEREVKADSPSFAWCAGEYIEAHRASWKNQKHIDQWESTLRMYAGPVIGTLPVDQVTLDHVLKILKPIWVSKPETASRLRGRIEKVLGWATAKTYRRGENPARWAGGELPHLLPAIGKVQKIEHHASVPYVEMPGLMTRLGRLDSTSARALRFTILTGARTGETIGAKWSEIDLEAAVWTIPGERMKAGVEHRVALSEEAVALLRSMPREGELVFPGPKGKVLSNMAMLKCLRGLREDGATVHGFRATFSTWARDETDYPRELIEASLAHAVGNAVEQAYNRSDYLAKRRALMADWGRYCEPSPKPSKATQVANSGITTQTAMAAR